MHQHILMFDNASEPKLSVSFTYDNRIYQINFDKNDKIEDAKKKLEKDMKIKVKNIKILDKNDLNKISLSDKTSLNQTSCNLEVVNKSNKVKKNKISFSFFKKNKKKKSAVSLKDQNRISAYEKTLYSRVSSKDLVKIRKLKPQAMSEIEAIEIYLEKERDLSVFSTM